MAWHLGRRAKDEWHDTCARDTAAAFRYVMRLQPGMAQSGKHALLATAATKPKATPFAPGQRAGAQATAASLGLHATGPPVPQTHAKTPILSLQPTADSKTKAMATAIYTVLHGRFNTLVVTFRLCHIVAKP